MPSARENREQISIRVSPAALEVVDHMAYEHRVSRSDVIRVAMSVGLSHKAEVEKRLAELA